MNLSGFLALLGIGGVLNTISGDWMFTREPAGTGLMIANVVITLAFFIASYVTYQRAVLRRDMEYYESHKRRMESGDTGDHAA